MIASWSKRFSQAHGLGGVAGGVVRSAGRVGLYLSTGREVGLSTLFAEAALNYTASAEMEVKRSTPARRPTRWPRYPALAPPKPPAPQHEICASFKRVQKRRPDTCIKTYAICSATYVRTSTYCVLILCLLWRGGWCNHMVTAFKLGRPDGNHRDGTVRHEL